MTTALIFAGGELVPIEVLDDLPVPDLVIAADSGYLSAVAVGVAVDVVIGDFDSLGNDSALPPETEAIRYPIDKDATDLELAFEFALGTEPDRIVLVGGEGGRFDHVAATTSLLASDRWARIPEIEWARTDSHCYVVRKALRIQGDIGALISLLPMGGNLSGVTTHGLEWPLSAERLAAGSSRGVSNRFAQPEVTIRVDDGVLLAIVPHPDSD
jgi:thiamine pyrophosphokinase